MADDTTLPDEVTKFDNILNTDYHRAEYDTRLNLAQTIVGGAVASVVDAGASIWNSLPGTPEVETRDILTRLSANAVQVYNEDPDAIQAISFIGGSLVPFGAATKGMNMARAGSKGVNWFSKAGKDAELANLNKLFAEAGASTTEYKSALRGYYGKGIANQALDAVAGEAAVVALMHNHPLMEDYMEDPVKNFAIGIGLGSVIGGTIGHVADRYVLKQLTGATSKAAIDATIGTLRDIAPDMTAGVALQSHEVNILNLQNILNVGKDAGKTAENDLSMSIAQRTLLSEQERQASLFDAIVSPEIKALPKDQRDVFMREVINRPEMFGVDKVSFLRQSEVAGSNAKNVGKGSNKVFMGASTPPTPALIDADAYNTIHLKYADIAKPTVDESNILNAFGFAREHNTNFGKYEEIDTIIEGMKSASKIGDKEAFGHFYTTLKDWLPWGETFGKDKVPAVEQALKDYAPKGTKGNLGEGTSSLTGKPTLSTLDPATQERSAVSGVFYKEFGKFGGVKDAFNYANAAALGKTVRELEAALPKNYGKLPNLDSSLELIGKSSAEVHGEYIAVRARVNSWDETKLANAVLGENDLPLMSAIVMRLQGDMALARKVSIQVADRSPQFKAILNEQAKTAGLNAAGVPESYAEAVAKFTKPGVIDQYSPGALGTISNEAKATWFDWLGGNQFPLQRGATSWSAKGFSSSNHTPTEKAAAKIFDEIYHSPESQALRDQFSRLADADGNVFLYRGSRASKIVQQNPLESYSTDPAKAAEFGTVRLFKVHVDNIVAGWGDLASHDGQKKNEILVLAGARPSEATLTADGKAVFSKQMENGQVIISDTNSKKVVLGDLMDMLVKEKQRVMDDMLYQGIPMEAISLKADIPLDVVESYALAKNGGSVDLMDMINDVTSVIKTKTLDDAEKAISPTNAPIKLDGNLRKNPYTEGHAALNNKEMKDMSDLISMTSMYSSSSPAATELARYLYEELKIPMDVLKQQLGFVNNEFAGSKFLNSTDFWARNMGSVGPIATAVGRQVQRITNDAIKRIVTPVSEAMSLVTKDPASVVEFNTFFNVNASLKGWRSFQQDGTLVQKVMRPDATGMMREVLEPVTYNGQTYKVTTDEVKKVILSMQEQGSELLALTNTGRKIKGQPDISDIGLWIPSFNPVNKFIAYVHNQVDDTTKMIWANTKETFADSVTAYKNYIKESGQEQKLRVVTKDEQADWNVLNGRLDVVNMERADVGMQKTGAASAAIVRSDTNVFSEIAGGYEHYITSQMRNLAELNMHEVTGMLDRMSVINQAITNNQPLSGISKVVNASKDSAATLKNTLLGNSNLGEYAGWKSINQSFETGLSFALNGVSGVWNTLTSPITKGIFGKEKALTPEAMKKLDYEKMDLLLKQKGIVNPWAAFDTEAANMFGLSKIEDSKDTSKRIVYASNALAATVALRIGELAQPLVNILSLPILTGLATASKMPAEFLGAKLGTANLGTFGGVQIMYEGARAANSPLWRKFDQLWEKQGHYAPLVSEASNVLRMSRSFEKGAISKIENALDSNMVQIMSKPADWSESFVRRQTMFTGAVLAKRLYPELSDEGITLFARDFMDKAVGNFHASQRPVFFQGTLGVALGLFQTYMLTLGQSVYRQLEMRNYKALGKAALTQATIFGGSSLPGFHQVSQMIGEHFSDENVDLTTGTYRALGDTAANFVLYGLPSNLGPSVYTRGDVSIRPPNVLAGAQNTVAVSFASQMLDTFGQLQRAMEGQGAGNIAQNIGQALSMQSMSRPLARGSELLTGYSVTRQGNTVQTPEEVWTATGIIARILGTRPLEESKLREAMHLNTFYGSVDRAARQKITSQLKTAIRTGELEQADLDKFSYEYMRKGGTPSGWRSAYNTAIAQTNVNGNEALIEKMKPNNPLNFMIDHLD